MPLTERCKTCLYYCDTVNHFVYPTCDYILRTGHMRGCPAGDECTKYFSRKDSVKLANPTGAATFIAATEQDLRKMYEQGMTDTEIAEAVESVPRAITRWRRKNGLPSQQALSRRVENED